METPGLDPVAEVALEQDVKQSARILFVASEPAIATLAECLRRAGYPTEHARTSTEALTIAEQAHPDLLILDADRLRGRTALARRLRARMGVDTPVLVIADHAQINAGTMAVTISGDRYLPKPFSPDDLVAQVRALLRSATGPEHHREAIVRVADLELNEDTLDVQRSGRGIALTPRERRILRYLLINAGRTVSRAEIVEHVWPYNHGGHRRVLDVHMSNLRRKINHTGRPLIHTVHSVGYLVQDPRASG